MLCQSFHVRQLISLRWSSTHTPDTHTLSSTHTHTNTEVYCIFIYMHTLINTLDTHTWTRFCNVYESHSGVHEHIQPAHKKKKTHTHTTHTHTTVYVTLLTLCARQTGGSVDKHVPIMDNSESGDRSQCMGLLTASTPPTRTARYCILFKKS